MLRREMLNTGQVRHLQIVVVDGDCSELFSSVVALKVGERVKASQGCIFRVVKFSQDCHAVKLR